MVNAIFFTMLDMCKQLVFMPLIVSLWLKSVLSSMVLLSDGITLFNGQTIIDGP